MNVVLSERKVIFILAVSVAVFFTGLLVIKAPSAVVLIASGSVAISLGLFWGVKWDQFHEGIIRTITSFLPAILLLIAVGMLIGSWIVCGTVPLLIYYGLKAISPSMFLVTSLLLCTLMSLATGIMGDLGNCRNCVNGSFFRVGHTLALHGRSSSYGCCIRGQALAPFRYYGTGFGGLGGLYFRSHKIHALDYLAPIYYCLSLVCYYRDPCFGGDAGEGPDRPHSGNPGVLFPFEPHSSSTSGRDPGLGPLEKTGFAHLCSWSDNCRGTGCFCSGWRPWRDIKGPFKGLFKIVRGR